MITKLFEFIATFFGIGWLTKAGQGTVASVVSAAIVVFWPQHVGVLFWSSLVLGIISVCGYYMLNQNYDDSDPKRFVIDEVIGTFLGLYFLSLYTELTLINITINLVLFRVFDIFKPFPIGYIEKLMYKSNKTIAPGIILDDMLAACLATALQLVSCSFV